MKHFTEEDLIAYQLHEAPRADAIREHLERCSECADLSESIAETLRVFSAEQAPRPDLDRSWQRLRGNLGTLPSARAERPSIFSRRWMLPVLGFAAAVLILIGVLRVRIHRSESDAQGVAFNGRQGPLTAVPVNANVADHLDAAERLLTEVNNSPGPLDETTRSQAHDLLMKNAVYVSSARDKGDVAQAAVLENLGRVLMTLDNEPPTPHNTWRLRLEMNTSGLLLDIRILQQNDDRSQGAQQ